MTNEERIIQYTKLVMGTAFIILAIILITKL
jgi:hypothetical protein